MKTETDTNRREFEERFKHFDLSKHPDGHYFDYSSEGAWQGWQAARERQDKDLIEARKEAEKYRNYYSNTNIARYLQAKAGQLNLPWENPPASEKI